MYKLVVLLSLCINGVISTSDNSINFSANKRCCGIAEIVKYNETVNDYYCESFTEEISNDLENVSVGFPKRCTPTMKNNRYDIWFQINPNSSEIELGLKFYMNRAVWLKIPNNSEYCLDRLKYYDDKDQILKFTDIIFFCELENFDEYLLQRKVYAGISWLNSCLIGIVTLIHFVLWSTHNVTRWLHTCLFLVCVLNTILYNIKVFGTLNGLNEEVGPWCFATSMVLFYTLVTFYATWTIVNFDLLRILWKLNSSVETRIKKRRLVLYGMFSLMFPAISVITSFMWLFHTEEDKKYLRGYSTFAFNRCLAPVQKPKLWILIFLWSIILTLFFLTGILICYYKTSTKFVQNKSVTSQLAESIRLYGKLLIVSGVLFIPFQFLEEIYGQYNVMSWYWGIARNIWILGGIFALRFFGFNTSNTTALRLKYRWFNSICQTLCLQNVNTNSNN